MTTKQSATTSRVIVAAASKRALPSLDPEQLYSRQDARPYLGGIHNATMIRLEQAGRLHPVKLNPSPTSKVHYRGSNLIALRDGGLRPEMK